MEFNIATDARGLHNVAIGLYGRRGFKRILESAMAVFEVKQRIPDNLSVKERCYEEYLNKIDGFVDAFYYLADAMTRSGLEMSDEFYVYDQAIQVKEFTAAIMGDEKPTDTIEFGLIMAYTELMEVASPNGKFDLMSMYESCYKNSSIEFFMSDVEAVMSAMATMARLAGKHFRVAFDEIHAANLAKGKRIDGKLVFETKIVAGKKKVIKPAGWTPPDLKRVIPMEECE